MSSATIARPPAAVPTAAVTVSSAMAGTFTAVGSNGRRHPVIGTSVWGGHIASTRCARSVRRTRGVVGCTPWHREVELRTIQTRKFRQTLSG